MTTFTTPAAGELFRHIDGGLYQFHMRVRHSDDQAPLFIYEHLWPFDTAGDPWARPAHEWASRFTPITREELEQAMKQDRTHAQAAVTEAKAKRRAAAGK